MYNCKTSTVYGSDRVEAWVYPQQHWELVRREDGKVLLERYDTVLMLPEEEFNANWELSGN